MKFHADSQNFEGCLPQQRISMRIKSSAAMFEILSSGIYKDKILAVIREYSANAYDSHKVAKKEDVPFVIRMPSMIDPTFSITDFGTGIDPGPNPGTPEDRLGAVYWTYGESSKTNDNDTIGALGLGSKSAFAYTKSSFIVKNRYNGIEYTYVCFINEDGEPQGSLVGSVPSDNENGVTVEFAVRHEDIYAFHDRTTRFFKYWGNTLPKIEGVEESEVLSEKPVKIISGSNWYLESHESAGHQRNFAMAIMGNIQYPIESSAIPNLPEELKIITDNPFVIEFPLGTLKFASSREALSYEEFTCNSLIQRLKEVCSDVKSSFERQVFDNKQNHIEFIHNFATTYAKFKVTFKVKQTHWVSSEDPFLKVLINKTINDVVKFKGVEFSVGDLTNGLFTLKRQGFQPYGLYFPNVKKRTSFINMTSLSFKANREFSKDTIFKGYIGNFDVGHEIISNESWKPIIFKKKKAIVDELNVFERVCKNSELFDVTTFNEFKLGFYKKVVFVVNNVGSSGPERFKRLVERGEFKQEHVIFANSSPVYSLDSIISDLQNIVDFTLTGSEIKLVSDFPDYREEIKKVKTDKSSIKLKTVCLKFTKHHNPITVQAKLSDCYSPDYQIDTKFVTQVSFHRLKITESVENLGDLTDAVIVPYIVKRRAHSKFYATTTSYSHIQYDDKFYNDNLNLAFYSGALDEIVTRNGDDKASIKVYVLTEGQIQDLKKKKVNVVPFVEIISKSVSEMVKTKDVVSRLETDIEIINTSYVSDFMSSVGRSFGNVDAVLSKIEASNGLFCSLCKQYLALNDDIKDLVMIARLSHVYHEELKVQSNSFTQQLQDRYPMLKYVSVKTSDIDRIQDVLAYVSDIDAKI